MALAGVLSALRTFILDENNFPSTVSERIESYRSRFPGLSSDEVEDLAAIPPEKIKIYTTSIFSSQRKVLRNKFPMTFGYIERYYQNDLKQPFRATIFMRDQHKHRPWRSNYTVELVDNFCAYLSEDRQDLKLAIPWLEDVVAFEKSASRIHRASDDTYTIRQSLTASGLTNLTVGDFLSLDFFIPHFNHFARFKFDIPRVFHNFVRENRTIPKEMPLQRETFAAAGRNRYLNARWTRLSESEFDYLSKIPKSERIPISDFADAFVTWSDDDETVGFQKFFGLVARLNEIGGIILLGN